MKLKDLIMHLGELGRAYDGDLEIMIDGEDHSGWPMKSVKLVVPESRRPFITLSGDNYMDQKENK